MVRRCVKLCTGHEYAAKIINTKKLSARGRGGLCAVGGAVRGGWGGTQGAGLWLLWDLNVAGETGTPSQIWGRSFALIWEPPWGWGGQRPSGQITAVCQWPVDQRALGDR